MNARPVTGPDAKLTLAGADGTQTVDLYSEEGLALVSDLWLKLSAEYKIMYEPTWLGRPIIQLPHDIVQMQELIWRVKPDLIIETGVAHGGSLILSASILELLGKGRVLGVDIDIRAHNRVAIEAHPSPIASTCCRAARSTRRSSPTSRRGRQTPAPSWWYSIRTTPRIMWPLN